MTDHKTQPADEVPLSVKKRQFWLCLPPIALCLIDHIITLLFQPAEYWRGTLHAANEANPHFNWLLRQHWLAFEAGIVAWMILFCAVIRLLPGRPAFLLSLAITIGHTWGAGTWISHHFPYGYWLTLGLCFLSAMLVAVTAELAGLVSYPGSK
jgi:hypothetical protein